MYTFVLHVKQSNFFYQYKNIHLLKNIFLTTELKQIMDF